MSDLTPKQNNFILYTTPEGEVKLNVLLENETIWLTQEQMSQLFDRERSVITKHIGNVFNEGELEEKSNVQILHISGSDKPVKFYNLDVIISVGYRVKSQRGTQFRIWATKTLKEYIIKGFVLEDNRLKQGEAVFGKDYFRELLERVRSIRASERRIYQQITDIFAECSIDYDPKAEITKNFYAMVQNKFHFAITGQTAAEIIFATANAKKENMGLTTWKNAPEGRILKSDTTIAKNYLQEKEIKQLERTVTGYFDYIENLIERENTFTMEGLANSVDKFLNFNEFKILEGK
ncbi:RhuM family protein [Flagellimonas marinaquae]|uniref:RhuM family protein n=1 Tax=Flagellimonas marinaquae TaxID=254955 RepID=UPI001F4938F5|nr:RhuM family protein [Allomuricauda aquimarina]